MKKTLHYLLASLLCAMTLGANAQTAADLYLDVTNYASIDDQGFKTSAVDQLYYWDEATGTLVVSVYGAYQSMTLQAWITADGTGSSSRTWEAPEGSVFKGSDYYHTTTPAKCATGNTSRTYSFKVTNVTAVSALVKSGGTSRNAVLNVYEGETLVGSAQDNTNAVAIISVDDLDASKTYSVQLTGDNSSNSDLYEVAFVADTGKQDVTITFPEEYYSVDISDVFNAPTAIVDPASVSVEYSSSDENVATVDPATGAVSIFEQGTTIITASFAGDETYNAASASYTLSVVPGAMLIDYPNTKEGITISGTTEEDATVKIHENTDAVTGYKLSSGYTTDGALNNNLIKLSVEGGFKKGDVLNIIGVYNNAAEKQANIALLSIEDESSFTVIYDGFEDFINGRLVNDDPEMQSYTLEEDYDVLYIGRKGNTATFLTLIQVVRPKQPETFEVTISESTYATYYNSSMALRAPVGVSVNLATIGENSVTLTTIGQVIPKGCPVVLHANAGTYTLQHEALYDDVENTRPNDLIGTDEGGTFGNDGAKYYVLSYKNKNKLPEEVGFYFLSGSKGAYAKLKAHQAYMRVTTTQANEAGYSLFETTGISTVETAATESDAPMYNLAGQRVNGSYRGVVIQNGVKKVNK